MGAEERESCWGEGLYTLLFLMLRAVSVHYSGTAPWKSTQAVVQGVQGFPIRGVHPQGSTSTHVLPAPPSALLYELAGDPQPDSQSGAVCWIWALDLQYFY